MIEDAVKQVLAGRAEQAPMRADGRAMLERVRRRERVQVRSRVFAAAAAVALLAGGGAWWNARTAPADSAVAAPRPHPSPSLRTAGWGSLRFDVPSSWTVNDTRETHSYPAGALVDGPFLGTLRTGPMCWARNARSFSCSRSHGILDKHPTEGVVAWINVGWAMTSVDGVPFGDQHEPGPGAAGVCPPGGTTFHAFRRIPRGGSVDRVALDGCAYGPRTQQYLRELRAVASSMRTVED